MKKFWKFLCGAASLVAVAFGAYCVYKKVAKKPEEEDFEFEDSEEGTEKDEREYVSINITAEDGAEGTSEEENPSSSDPSEKPTSEEEAKAEETATKE